MTKQERLAVTDKFVELLNNILGDDANIARRELGDGICNIVVSDVDGDATWVSGYTIERFLDAYSVAKIYGAHICWDVTCVDGKPELVARISHNGDDEE